MLCITDQQVKDKLDLSALIDAMSDALQDFSTNKVVQPQRTIIPTPQGGFIGLMPAIYPDFMGVKMVTYGVENAGLGLPTYHAMVQLFDTATGIPLATIEGGVITELRTAAVSAVATKILSSPSANKLAVLGSGAQARAHLEIFMHLNKFAEISLWSRNEDKCRALAEEFGIKAVSTAEEAVSDADVIVAATAANKPVLLGKWIKKGAHVNSVGAFGQGNRELDDELMSQVVIVDSREAAGKESGDIVESGATIYAELGELVAGIKPLPGDLTTVFKSVGMAVEDVAAAKLVYSYFKS